MKIKMTGSLSGWLIPATYACNECGYVGTIVLEVDDEDRPKEKMRGTV
jgi:phage-related protein